MNSKKRINCFDDLNDDEELRSKNIGTAQYNNSKFKKNGGGVSSWFPSSGTPCVNMLKLKTAICYEQKVLNFIKHAFTRY